MPRDPAIEEYRTDLEAQVKEAWLPPVGMESVRVKVVFKVQKNGDLTNLRILISSGLPSVDAAAVESIKNASPFNPLPEYFSHSLDVQFAFGQKFFCWLPGCS